MRRSDKGDPSPVVGPADVWWPKRFRLGQMLGAMRRRRRAPVAALRAEVAERRDRRSGRLPSATPRTRAVRSVVCFLAGPADRDALFDSIDSVVASDGDAAQVLVADDSSLVAREAVVREHYPAADVVRNSVSTGGPPHLWYLCRLGIERALERYDFEQWVKMDCDALVTGPDFSTKTLARLADAPQAGMAGCTGVRADGAPTDYRVHASILRREVRHDRTLAAAVEQATARGWKLGDNVHGGAFVVTRAACEALRREGWLQWRRPWYSLLNEDVALSLFVAACGFELQSVGGPDGIFCIANKSLILPKEEIADGPWVMTHSVRKGLEGEDEATLRAFFRERRSAWPSP